MPKQTKKIEETVIVNDAPHFRQWFEELLMQFEDQASYPESVTLSVEWEKEEEGDDGR